jgi:hypothetical protein
MNPSDKLVDYLISQTEDIGAYIKELAKQLGVAAEHVYGVLIRQQYVEGVSYLIKAGIWLAVFISLWCFVIWLWRKYAIPFFNKTDEEDIATSEEVGLIGSVMTIGTVALGIITLFTFIWIVGLIEDGVQHLLSPEYFALKEIMTFIEQSVGEK